MKIFWKTFLSGPIWFWNCRSRYRIVSKIFGPFEKSSVFYQKPRVILIPAFVTNLLPNSCKFLSRPSALSEDQTFQLRIHTLWRKSCLGEVEGNDIGIVPKNSLSLYVYEMIFSRKKRKIRYLNHQSQSKRILCNIWFTTFAGGPSTLCVFCLKWQIMMTRHSSKMMQKVNVNSTWSRNK